MEAWVALVAGADHERRLGHTDLEGQGVAGRPERNDEFALRRPTPSLPSRNGVVDRWLGAA